MNSIGSVASSKVMNRLVAPGAFQVGQVRAQNAAPDLAERGDPIIYPAVYIYCEKVINSLVEKFRTFSGTAQMVIELRLSQDRLTGLQEALESAVDTAMQTLDANRGDWGDGMYYCGGYQAAFGAAKHGGKNYVQTAKVTFEIGVSIS